MIYNGLTVIYSHISTPQETEFSSSWEYPTP